MSLPPSFRCANTHRASGQLLGVEQGHKGGAGCVAQVAPARPSIHAQAPGGADDAPLVCGEGRQGSGVSLERTGGKRLCLPSSAASSCGCMRLPAACCYKVGRSLADAAHRSRAMHWQPTIGIDVALQEGRPDVVLQPATIAGVTLTQLTTMQTPQRQTGLRPLRDA